VSQAPAADASSAPALGAPAADAPARVELVDAQRVLSLFTQGLSGRYLHLKPVDALTGEFRPEIPTTDGTAIYLPGAVALFGERAHNLGVYRIAVLHQLGFYENGTFAFTLARARERVPGLPAEPAQGLGHPSELERYFALWPAPGRVRRLFMMLEDMRIDRALTRRYPGARHDLARVLARALADRPPLPDGTTQPAAALAESLLRYTLGADAPQLLAHDRTGRLAALLRAAAAAAAPDASVYDTAAATAACLAVLGVPARVDIDPDEPARPAPPGSAARAAGAGDAGEEGDDEAPLPDLDAFFEGDAIDFRGELRPELVQRQLRGGHTGLLPDAQPPEADGAETDAQPETPAQAERRRMADESALRRAFGLPKDATRSWLYDEWDYHRQGYLKGWCRLYEYRLRGDDHDLPEQVRRRHGELIHEVRRQFRFIRPDAYVRVRRVSDGEEIELDGVIEAAVDRRAGHATDEHVYRRRDRALREVSAAFLLDMSASTDFPVPDPEAPPPPPEPPPPPDGEYVWGNWSAREPLLPEPPKRRVIDVARESLALMAQALETLGDSYAIWGFSGYGRDDVEFHVAKDFDDRLRAREWAALAAMQPRRSTRMGPAIRHAVARLQMQATRLKVLIVISDGYPQDRDYGPDRNDDEYGIQDTAQALREAQHAGVQTFCVTIDPAGHDYLRRMCPDERYLVIDEVAALPRELSKVYRALTA
jgi:hypothetical protein